MNSIQNKERRRYLRYQPHSVYPQDLEQKAVEAICHIDVNNESDNFNPALTALILDKSHSGCSVLITRKEAESEQLKEKIECVVKSGPLHPLRAVVRWRQDINAELAKVGFQYSE